MNRTLVLSFLLPLTAIVAMIGACADDPRNTPPAPAPSSDGGVVSEGGPMDLCATPASGCPCDEPGEIIECGSVKRQSDDYIACSMGQRTCNEGTWGACIGDAIAMVRPGTAGSSARSVDPSNDGLQPAKAGGTPTHTLGLGVSQPCVGNPCDPYCVNIIDTPTGVTPGPGLEVSDAGITLTSDSVGGGTDAGTACTGITVSPSPQVLTITSISPLITSPLSLSYKALLVPAGCSADNPNDEAAALWSLDALDLAAINATGQVNLYSPVAGPIKVLAYSGPWQATGLANVVVNINETSQAPIGTAVKFVGPGVGVDPMTIRYPYDNTVFPRSIKAPVIQWKNGGSAAQAVKISLRYPAGTGSIFTWSTIIPESTPYAQALIPQAIWAAFDRTAQGDVADYVVQRLIGGVLKAEVVRQVRFSTKPLKGTIYYTEYSDDPTPTNDDWAYERSINVNNPTAPPVNPYAASGLTETGSNKCPVCHSVSANGRIFVTSDKYWSSNGGAAAIDSAGKFSLLGDITATAPNQGSAWRGFSWAGITPDGKYSITGPNSWGNTDENPPTEAGGNGTGLKAEFFNNNNLSGAAAITNVSTTINFNWGNTVPNASVTSATLYSVRWSGLIQATRSDLYTFQSESLGGARLFIDGVKLFENWADSASATAQVLTGQANLISGKKHAIIFEYLQTAGKSQARLRWGSPNSPILDTNRVPNNEWFVDIIPQSQLYPPPLAAPTNGLLATYYPTKTLTGTAATPGTTQYDPTVNFSWMGAVPAAGIAATNFSARWTGRLQATTDGAYSFQTVSKDGIRLWVDKHLIIDRWSASGTNPLTDTSAAITLNAGQYYDIKVDYYGTTGTKLAIALKWKPPAGVYAVIPTANLFPTNDDGTPDVTFDGSLLNSEDFVMWQLTNGANNPQAPALLGTPAGLAGVAMMVPSFSPDGTKLVFIDGDTGGGVGAGWRKGMSTLNFNAATKTFSGRKELFSNTWPLGAVLKWPTFEPDSKSVIFNNSSPGDYCNCSTPYGNMAPTNYHGVIGQLWSIDSSAATPVAKPLTNANMGELPEDADKSYQATVLPTVAGGYRWAVFTSTRPYGNLLNVAGTAPQDASAQVWVSAIDDTVSGAADRSHPAFWLPNQNIQLPATTRKYSNERAFWALDACKPAATTSQTATSANLCQESADCCGAPTTAACKIDVPVGSPAVRHCVQTAGNVCVGDGGSCSAPSECCNFPLSVCANNICVVPPPPPTAQFAETSFIRDYQATCPIGTHVVWRFFDWKTITPGDSKITFAVKSADTQAELPPLTSVDIGVASGAPITNWTGADVGKALLPSASRDWLRVTMTFTPTTDNTNAPTLTNWRQNYSCPPSE